MKKLFDYVKLAVFVVGVLVGIQIPGFVDQYGKNLDARVSESSKSVAQFQDDADKFFDGDMDRLSGHYKKTRDPVIVSGGSSITALVTRNERLRLAQQDFQQSTFGAYVHVLINPVHEVRQDVWGKYTYEVVLNVSAIAVGVAIGLLALGFFELVSSFLMAMFRPGKYQRKGNVFR